MSRSKYDKVCKTDKSEFLNCLQEIQELSYDTTQDMEMIVIDGAALVHMSPSKHSKAFGEYCESELGEKPERVAVPVNQLGLFFDVYREDSLKAETLEGRGDAARVSVKDSTPIYSDFKKFFKHSDNKTELFFLIADKVLNSHRKFLQQLFAPNYLRLLQIQKMIFPLCFPAARKKQTQEYSFTSIMKLKMV